MQVCLNTLDGRATAVVCLLQVLQRTAQRQQGSLRSTARSYASVKLRFHPRAKSKAGRWLKRFKSDDFT
eukprot:740708-Pleurochrysis_carterae.AAC.1